LSLATDLGNGWGEVFTFGCDLRRCRRLAGLTAG